MNVKHLLTLENIWLGVGLLGQGLFSMRLIVQWIQSEYHKKSVIPVAFWYYSLIGGLLLLAYALYRKDPVFVLGQLFGTVIYARNLHLIYREKKASLCN